MTTTAPMDLIFDWYLSFLIYALIGGVVVGWLTRTWRARIFWFLGYGVFWLFVFSAHYQQMASADGVLIALVVWTAIFIGAVIAGVILQYLVMKIGVMQGTARPTLRNSTVFLLFVVGMIATLMGAKASGLRTVSHPTTGMGAFFSHAIPFIDFTLSDEWAHDAGICVGYLRTVGERDDDERLRRMGVDIQTRARHRVNREVFRSAIEEGVAAAQEDEGNVLALGRKLSHCRDVYEILEI